MPQLATDRWIYGIAKQGWTVYFITTAHPHLSNILNETIDGMHIHYVPSAKSRVYSKEWYTGAMEVFDKIRASTNVDVVHLESRALNNDGIKHVRDAGLKIGMTWHGTSYDDIRTAFIRAALWPSKASNKSLLHLEFKVKEAYEDLLYLRENINFHVATSVQAASDLAKVYQIPKNRIFPIITGVNYDPAASSSSSIQQTREAWRKKLSISSDMFVIAFVGRLVQEKGLPILIEAIKLLENERKIVFVIAGNGTDLKKVKLVSKTNAQVRILGVVDHKNLNILYQSIDLLVDPSVHYHGLNMCVLEAIAMGVPVLSADTARATSTFGESIYYFESGSGDDLTHKIRMIAKTESALRKKDTKWSVRVSMTECVSKYDALFKMFLPINLSHTNV